MAYGFEPFPQMKFDWLANLPNVMEGARLRGAQREALADLDPRTASPDEIDRRGMMLLAAGDIEGFKTLYAQSTARRESQRRAAADTAYLGALPGLLNWTNRPGGGGPSSTKEEEGAPFDPLSPMIVRPKGKPTSELAPQYAPEEGPPVRVAGPVVPLPVGPSPNQGLPNAAERMQGYGNPQVPMITPQSPQGYDNLNRQFNRFTPGPRGAELSPSDAVLAAAEGGGAVPPRGPQFAQAGPPPPMQPRSQEIVDPFVQARRDAYDAAQQAIRLGPKASPSQREVVMSTYRDALSRAGMKGKMLEYQIDRLQTRVDNSVLPPEDRSPEPTYRQWRAEEESAAKTRDDAISAYKGHSENWKKADDLSNVLAQMKILREDPRFAAGGSAPGALQWAGTQMAGIQSALKALGVNVPVIGALTDMAALGQAYESLSNAAVKEALGTLGNQISEGDRNFIRNAFPHLQQTELGQKLIEEFLGMKARRDQLTGETANAYMERKGPFASRHGLDKEIRRLSQDYMMVDRDGKLTPFGERVRTAVSEAKAIKSGEVGPARRESGPAGPYGHLEGRTGTDENGKRFTIKNGQKVLTE